MRAAPPLALDLGTGLRERAAVAALAAASATTGLGWALWHLGALAFWPLMPLAAAGAAALAFKASRPATGRLAWTGRHWAWTQGAEPQECQVAVLLAAGPWLLLRVQPPTGTARWAGVWRGQAGSAAWHGLRATLHLKAAAP